MKNVTCNTCDKRDNCKQLCENMIKKLSDITGKNKAYSEATYNNYNKCVANIDDISLYSYGLSDIEERDFKRIMIAILTKDQIKVLKLYSEGYSQKEIGEKLNVTQSNISQKLLAIKKALKNTGVLMIPYISN